MRDDFAIFILTHGRPNNVYTYNTLRRKGYTGKIYIVIDDEDKKAPEYYKRFGSEVLQFSKEEIAKTFDQGDNRKDRRVIVYARNACFQLAKQVGVRYFMQLDDDYLNFKYRVNDKLAYKDKAVRKITPIIRLLLDWYLNAPLLTTLAMSQSGDHMEGKRTPHIETKRKAMNSMIHDVEKPVTYVGRINEDVNTYVLAGIRGELFLTTMAVSLQQRPTQTQSGGMTEIYLEGGTYIKSFYTVMYAPSCTHIANLVVGRRRLHHRINWRNAAVKLLHERYRKPDQTPEKPTKQRQKES